MLWKQNIKIIQYFLVNFDCQGGFDVSACDKANEHQCASIAVNHDEMDCVLTLPRLSCFPLRKGYLSRTKVISFTLQRVYL